MESLNPEDRIVIAGLPLPVALAAAILEGRWKVPALAAMRNVFYEEPDRPKFYDLSGIRATSVAWQSGYPGVGFQEFYLGVENSEKPPGNLTPHQSLIIGDLGPDMPFALDYRASCSRPAVVELTTYDNWRYVADDIDEFLEKLGLAS